MTFPVYFSAGPVKLHPHFVFETGAYLIAFRLYLALRKRQGDALDDQTRWWMIAAAAIGAVVGSRVLYWFEDPGLTLAHWRDLGYLMGGKTIAGALVGGLASVELAKRHFGVTLRTGDLFAVPLSAGIAVGRVGCFLTGLEDHTAGIPTSLAWGVNFGDGLARHPTKLYEAAFALALGAFLLWRSARPHSAGDLFKGFMVGYFAFRLLCDFLKPDVRVLLGLSSIQWVSVLALGYYAPDVLRWWRGRPASVSEGVAAGHGG